MVVSNIFYFHPYLGKISNLTNIFQMGWNHQPVMVLKCWKSFFFNCDLVKDFFTNKLRSRRCNHGWLRFWDLDLVWIDLGMWNDTNKKTNLKSGVHPMIRWSKQNGSRMLANCGDVVFLETLVRYRHQNTDMCHVDFGPIVFALSPQNIKKNVDTRIYTIDF